MKIRNLKLTFVIISATLLATLGLGSCDETPKAPTDTDAVIETTADTGTDGCPHELGESKVILEATCTKVGVKEATCSLCAKEITNTIPATGHTEVTDEAVAATCEGTGLTAGSHCSTCGEVLVPQQTLEATGHQAVVDPAVAATCTSAGLAEGSHCGKCQKILVAREEVPATGHKEVVDQAVAATCEANGLTTGKHCSTCNAVLVAQEVLKAPGHTEVSDPAIPASCTSTGLTEGSHCSKCQKILTTREEIPATGHTEMTVPGVAPSCIERGLSDGTQCSVCRAMLVGQQILQATGHTYDNDSDPDCNTCGDVRVIGCAHEHTKVLKAVEATCTSDGLTEGLQCTDCDLVLVEQTIVSFHTTDGKCEVCNEYVLYGEYTFFRLAHPTSVPVTYLSFEYMKDGQMIQADYFQYDYQSTGSALYFGTQTAYAENWKIDEQYIVIKKPQTVSEDVYKFIVCNTTPGKYELSGKWLFEYDQFPAGETLFVEQDIHFTYLDLDMNEQVGTNITLYRNTSNGMIFNKNINACFNGTDCGNVVAYADFGLDGQVVSKEFYTAFTQFAYSFEDNVFKDYGYGYVTDIWYKAQHNETYDPRVDWDRDGIIAMWDWRYICQYALFDRKH